MIWTKGRLKTGYLVATFFKFKWLDLHVVMVPKDAYVPYHFDEIPGKKHFRLNFQFGNYTGGKFICPGACLTLFKRRLVCFRPDLCCHKLSKVRSGTAFILSLGLAI